MKKKLILLSMFTFLLCILHMQGAYAERYLVQLNSEPRAQLYAAEQYHLDSIAESVGIYATEDETLARRLVASGIAKAMAKDIKVELHSEEYNDEYFSVQWNMQQCNILKARKITTGSPEVRVAVIDSGLKTDHPDFNSANILPGQSFINKVVESDTTDTIGHGTTVTGIIAATANNGIGIAGIADNVKIMPIRFVSTSGGGNIGDLISSVEYAMKNGCKVINMSAGFSMSKNASDDTKQAAEMFKDMVQKAYDNNIIIVASVGNDGEVISDLSYPAAYNTVVGVGSTNQIGTHAGHSRKNKSVWICAPGMSIPSTAIDKPNVDTQPIADNVPVNGTGYGKVTGTSFAAPHISALAALAASVNPDITPAEFMQYLRSTATDRGRKGYDIEYGYGLVNMSAVLKAAQSDLSKASLSAAFGAGDVLTAQIVNRSTEAVSGSLLLASYDAGGTLKSMTTLADNISAEAGETVQYPADAVSLSDDAAYVRLFLWNDRTQMQPLTNAAEYPVS